MNKRKLANCDKCFFINSYTMDGEEYCSPNKCPYTPTTENKGGDKESRYAYPSFPSDIDQITMSAAASIANLRTIVGKRSRRRELIAIEECEKILKYAKIINEHLRYRPASPTKADKVESLAVKEWVKPLLMEFIIEWGNAECSSFSDGIGELGCKHCLAEKARAFLTGLGDVTGKGGRV